MNKRPPIAHLALLSYLVFSAPLHAETEAVEPLVTFSGFGTVGVVHNQGKGSAFYRDITEAKGATNKGLFWETDTRIGLQATVKATENLDVVAQVISRYRTENNFQPELTWGFLKYSPNDTVVLRAGRIGFDVFLAADSRDVGFSYLWVRPPVEYYGAIPVPYIDGGDVVFHMPIGNGVSRLKLYSGLARQQVSSLMNQTQWAGNIQANVGSVEDLFGSRVVGGILDYQDNNWILRLGKADIRLNHEFPALGGVDVLGSMRLTAQGLAQIPPLAGLSSSLNALANDISLTDKHITFTSLGLGYENGPLRTQMALSHFGSGTLLFPESDSGYLSAGYRYGKFTPYAVISAVRSKKITRADELAAQVPAFALATPAGAAVGSLASTANFMFSTGQQVQHTFSVGTRYDLTSNAALKFQVDMIRNNTCSPVSLPGGASAPCSPPLLWTSVPVSWDGHATVYSAVLDFTF